MDVPYLGAKKVNFPCPGQAARAQGQGRARGGPEASQGPPRPRGRKDKGNQDPGLEEQRRPRPGAGQEPQDPPPSEKFYTGQLPETTATEKFIHGQLPQTTSK